MPFRFLTSSSLKLQSASPCHSGSPFFMDSLSWVSVSVVQFSSSTDIHGWNMFSDCCNVFVSVLQSVLVSSTQRHWWVSLSNWTARVSCSHVLIVSPGSVSIADWPSLCMQRVSPPPWLGGETLRHTLHTLQLRVTPLYEPFTQDTSPSKGPWALSFVSPLWDLSHPTFNLSLIV